MNMNRSLRLGVILGLLSLPALAGAAGPDPDEACGRGFVPTNGPARSGGPSVRPGACGDAEHPAAPHVHRDGRWIGHEAPIGDRPYEQGRPLEQGRFTGPTGANHIYTVRGRRERFDAGGGSFSVAPSESKFCDDWRWDAEPIAIYEDPEHPGWYLAYSMRLGTFVHVQVLGPAEAAAPVVQSRSLLVRIASFLVRGTSTLGK